MGWVILQIVISTTGYYALVLPLTGEVALGQRGGAMRGSRTPRRPSGNLGWGSASPRQVNSFYYQISLSATLCSAGLFRTSYAICRNIARCTPTMGMSLVSLPTPMVTVTSPPGFDITW
jgi:hypothetical protein